MAAPPRQPLGQMGRAPDPTLRVRAGGRPRSRPPPSVETDADGDAADPFEASESLAGSPDGPGSYGSSDDDSSERETGSEPDSNSADAD